jgi:hypothetical protein
MKYSQLSANCNAYEVCFYWEDANGIETLEGLFRWESDDYPINRLYKVDSREEAEAIINNKKTLKQYAI